MHKFVIGFIVALIGLPTSLLAETKSHYSKIDLDRCDLHQKAEEGDGEWATFRCNGFNGAPVYVTEADLRFALGYGNNGLNQKSMSQFLSPFNTVSKTLEWRLRSGRPVATILRYFTETGSGGKKGQILVVTKVGQFQACHVAYIDALANKDANKLAQFAADNIAPNFNCNDQMPVHVGQRGVSPF